MPLTFPAGLVGLAGFEPAYAGVKVPCLTAWRYPNMKQVSCANGFYRAVGMRVMRTPVGSHHYILLNQLVDGAQGGSRTLKNQSLSLARLP